MSKTSNKFYLFKIKLTKPATITFIFIVLSAFAFQATVMNNFITNLN